MAGIKAIETHYKGYKFRSRLEARWAVFFDAIGVRYDYEPEGLDLDGLWYLPDFWLPDFKTWVEVKPHTGDWPDAFEPCQRLGQSVDDALVLMLAGNCWPGEHRILLFPLVDKYDVCRPLGEFDSFNHYAQCEYDGMNCTEEFTACRRCAGLCISSVWHPEGDEAQNQGGRDFGPHTCEDHDKLPCTGQDNELLCGYRAARSARFEHGETPR